jgi:hypothetical protein
MSIDVSFSFGGFRVIADVFGVPAATYAFCLTSIIHLAIKKSVPGLEDQMVAEEKDPESK